MTFEGVRLLKFINQGKVDEIPFLSLSKALDYRFIYQGKVEEIPFLRPSKALDYLDLFDWKK